MGDLMIDIKPNEFSWAYHLNTQVWPTYAGEVVQILSAYIDNITISGDVRRYSDMERIYGWFLHYIQIATQGFAGKRYDERPVTFQYPHRGWQMLIKPINLPALRYARDVVVPTWQIEASVLEPDPEQTELTLEAAQLDPFKTSLTADIGFRELNPFSYAKGVLTKEEVKDFKLQDSHWRVEAGPVPTADDEDANFASGIFGKIVESYKNGDFTKGVIDALGHFASSTPDFTSKKDTQTKDKTKDKTK